MTGGLELLVWASLLSPYSPYSPYSPDSPCMGAVGVGETTRDEPRHPDPADEPLPAPDPDRPQGEPEPTWVVGGFVDVAYLFNHNFPGNHLYAGAVTTPRTGEITPNVVAAYVHHQPTDDQPWRFELALHAGAAVDALYEPEPIPGDAAGAYAGAEVFKHIALANGGYRFASGTEITAGLMASPIGFGAFWSKDNWTYSPAWASNGVPYYLMGAHVTQALPAGFALHGWVVNGWQTIADANRTPSGMLGVEWSRGDTTALAQVYFGPEQPDPAPTRWLTHADTQVVWDAHPVGVAVVADAGREGWSGTGADMLWLGGGIWVRGDLWTGRRSRLVLAGRPEAWWDRDGRIFGALQVLVSGTIGPSLYIRDLLQVRLEYRYDRSLASSGFFLRGDSLTLTDEQHTVFANLLAKFEHAFARRRPR